MNDDYKNTSEKNNDDEQNIGVEDTFKNATLVNKIAFIVFLVLSISLIVFIIVCIINKVVEANLPKTSDNQLLNGVGNLLNELDNSRIDMEEFNKIALSYIGSGDKTYLGMLIDEIINQNNKYSNKKIIIGYNGKEYVEEGDLIQLKKKFDSKVTYNITVEYDNNGYVSKINIDKDNNKK